MNPKVVPVFLWFLVVGFLTVVVVVTFIAVVVSLFKGCV